MKVLIMSKNSILVKTRTRYSSQVIDRYVRLYYNIKINDWNKFINYIKKYED